MINLDTTWQQACAALAEGQFNTAFNVLIAAMR